MAINVNVQYNGGLLKEPQKDMETVGRSVCVQVGMTAGLSPRYMYALTFSVLVADPKKLRYFTRWAAFPLVVY